MNDITEFFSGLFDTHLWPPRWQCGEWSNFHGWVYIFSELMIWTAYFLIPVIILYYFSRRKAAIKFRRVYVLFATFILLCGSTHFIDALMFWIPMYRFNALVRLITGIVSLFTVYHLVKVLPEIFRQRSNTELELEIARRQEAEKKLFEANRGLEAFAYVASHDLREPLRKISIYNSRLNTLNQNQYNEKSKELSVKLSHAASRMQELIEDVLKLSTLNTDISFNTVSLEDVMKRSVENLEFKIGERQANIKYSHLPQVHGNEGYLIQLFTNLLHNAIKFSDKQPVIEITAEKIDGKVDIRVKDNGIGMNNEYLARIFEPFQRLNAKEEYEGSGIGLAISKKIVDIHLGGIDVESTPGEGTTFTITLPAA